MDRPYFEPWVGRNYKNGGIFGKKILALGDSHYCDSCVDCGVAGGVSCIPDFTKEVISDYLDGYYGKQGWPTTMKKFERLISGNENTERSDAIAIWNSISFYNFLQTANNSNARVPYYGEYYEKSLPYFWTVLDELSPDIVIVWGKKVWGYLPIEGWVYEPVEGYNEIGYYVRNEKKITFIDIYHPSYPHSLEEESRIIKRIIDR